MTAPPNLSQQSLVSPTGPCAPVPLPSRRKRKRSILFSFLYASTYAFFYIVLLTLLLVTPGDTIRQAIANKQYYNIIVVGVVFLVTAILVSFVYVTRLYMTRNVLVNIPRQLRGWGVAWYDGGWSSRRIATARETLAADVGGHGRLRGDGNWSAQPRIRSTDPAESDKNWLRRRDSRILGAGTGGTITMDENIRRVIKLSLSRNAAIAWDSKPRVDQRRISGGFDRQATEPKMQPARTATTQTWRISGRRQTTARSFVAGSLERHYTVLTRRVSTPPTATTAKTKGIKLSIHRLTSRKDKRLVRQRVRVSLQDNCIGRHPTLDEAAGVLLPPHGAVWGLISHAGWSSPDSPDMPNLHFESVRDELPNIIEAKAHTLVSQMPGSPNDDFEESERLTALTRDALVWHKSHMDMRGYLVWLSQLGVFGDNQHSLWTFIEAYERVRYSTRPMTEYEFKDLMHHFATLLRSMRAPPTGWASVLDFTGRGSGDAIHNRSSIFEKPELRKRGSDADGSPVSSLGLFMHNSSNTSIG